MKKLLKSCGGMSGDFGYFFSSLFRMLFVFLVSWKIAPTKNTSTCAGYFLSGSCIDFFFVLLFVFFLVLSIFWCVSQFSDK
mmetsp:Transcript_55981/g.117116  ORF Transcript_55981/g.117116 Transcript_55981/m.117116 type:complete len:81 (-) Transcript_55981:31-273(-)